MGAERGKPWCKKAGRYLKEEHPQCTACMNIVYVGCPQFMGKRPSWGKKAREYLRWMYGERDESLSSSTIEPIYEPPTPARPDDAKPLQMKANPWNISKLLSEITCMGCDEAHDVVIGMLKKYANEKGRVFLSSTQTKIKCKVCGKTLLGDSGIITTSDVYCNECYDSSTSTKTEGETK